MKSLNELILRNLEQSRARTVLTALSISIGVAIIAARGVFQTGIEATWGSDEGAAGFIFAMTGLLFTGVGAMILLAAGFLIFNAFAMTVTQRQQQIGMLRALGMTQKQVMRLVLYEALATGGIGTLVGLLLGPPLGQSILTALSQFGLEAGQGTLQWPDLLLAIVMGMGITLFASLTPARRAATVSPMVAIRETLDTEHAPQNRRGGQEKQGNGFLKPDFSAFTRVFRAIRVQSRAFLGFAVIITLWTWALLAPPGAWAGYHNPLELGIMVAFWLTWLLGVILLAPALLQAALNALTPLLFRFGGLTGRLAADNLIRSPSRLTLTALSFTIGVAVMIGTAGMISFGNDVLLGTISKNAIQQAGIYVRGYDNASGVGQMNTFGNTAISQEVLDAVHETAGDRAEVGTVYIVTAKEISAVVVGFPSFLVSASEVERFRRPEVFNLLEGDRAEMVRLLLQPGCAFTTSIAVAAKHNAKQGDLIRVTSLNGPVDCVFAGVGNVDILPISVLGPGALADFVPPGRLPDTVVVHPLPNTDRAALEKDVFQLEQRFPGQAFISKADQEVFGITHTSDQLMIVFNGMVFLGIIAAAFGMLNTVMVSILERQKEIGLLRAVGATRQQIVAMLVLESTLTGLLGALLGLVAGLGIAGLSPLTEGGVGWSLPNIDLRAAAIFVLGPAFRNGWWSLLAAPLMAGLIAWPVARSAVRGAAVDALQPERREPLTRSVGGIFARGSLRVRFALGTGLLLTVILVGLVSVVIYHARQRIETQLLDGLTQMVKWNAGLLELSLPSDASTLTLETVKAADSPFQFDSDNLLRLEKLISEMTENGLVDFSVVDAGNAVILSVDEQRLGDKLPPLETITPEAHSVTQNGRWRMVATAPVRNKDGEILGSVRLTVDPSALDETLSRLRNTLLLVGLGIILLGVLASVWLVTPLSRAAGQLAAHAAEIGQGRYTPIATAKPAPGWGRLSLRARLTIILTVFVLGLVLGLEFIAIPIEKNYLDETTRNTLLAGAKWVGRAMSETLGMEPDLPANFDFTTLDVTQLPTLDLARVQELSDVGSHDMAYLAFVNADGKVALSDQLALVGEQVGVPDEATFANDTWRGATVWVVSTPIRKGTDGEVLGALRFAIRTERLDAFVAESRSLFNLVGVIAVLAGILLAQAIGGAVSSPVRTLATGARRVAEGDLSTRFAVNSRDELAILASAYNQMVTGLQEREWLRDMFGRFVSQEVAEAIRSGQVKLEGENRVVSVLFCDIRDFTGRSERHTPQEIVALLNEYLPVVVSAAQSHGGTVNKFGGDSTLVIYGAPKETQESAYRAVLTALDLRAGLEGLNEHLAARGEAPIRIGVGINTGLALAGAVGPRERQEYTVIGDSVNLASRIEALNKQYPEHGILISEWTYEALGNHRAEFDLLSLGKVEIRGKAEGVGIWAVKGQARV